MEPVLLRSDGYEAVFFPQRGMNLLSFKKGDIQLIDQSTNPLFEERNAGLGAMIGPHFHRRHPGIIPPLLNESAFPHIARLKAKGDSYDPFSHGIGRYAPWTYTTSENSIHATLKGSDMWEGVALSALEGQNFTMNYNAFLTATGLRIELSVVSDTDSIIGIHYYYHLPEGKGEVSARVKDHYLIKEGKASLPSTWNFNRETHLLTFPLVEEADYTFFGFPDPTAAEIYLTTPLYKLKTRYSCASEENAWQLYHPKNASYVCIEPVSAQDPRHPNLTVSSLTIELSVESRTVYIK